MLRWVYTLTAAAALIATGIVQGFWTNRWTEDTATKQAATRLTKIPLRIGEWEGETIEVAPLAGVAGSLQRSYTCRRLGLTVNIALVTGQPGPVATHTPEVCYGASGYTVGKREPVKLGTTARPAQFWTSDATRTKATEESRLRLYWGWNAGEGWLASEDARRQFPRFKYPVLHKLYVIRELGPGDTGVKQADEACIKFLELLVPVLEKELFDPAS